jgi:hypothetical protein
MGTTFWLFRGYGNLSVIGATREYFAPRKRLNIGINLLPTTQVEIPYAEISPISLFQVNMQLRQEWLFDIVVNAGHLEVDANFRFASIIYVSLQAAL